MVTSILARYVHDFDAIFEASCAHNKIEQTLPSKQCKQKDNIQMSECHGGIFEKPSQPASIRYLLRIPVIRALCLSGAGLSFMSVLRSLLILIAVVQYPSPLVQPVLMSRLVRVQPGFFDIYLTFCVLQSSSATRPSPKAALHSTYVLFIVISFPTKTGHSSPQATQIGYALSISGCVSIFLQLFCMPYLLRRFDNARMYNFCMGLWPFCFVLLPGLNILARLGSADLATGELDPAMKTFVWMGICVILTISRAAALAFS